jgi:multidrug efflux pump subunit AcrA (membrane-fusion protein)
MNGTFKIASLALIALAVAGCARNEAAETPPAPPQVSVAKVIEKPITEFDEFTGRFAAVDRVELRPRVSGYISSINFTEGREVRKGDVLFVIDPTRRSSSAPRPNLRVPQRS